MKVIVDNGKPYSPDEIAFGMTRYSVFDGESIIDADNGIYFGDIATIKDAASLYFIAGLD